MTSMLPVAPAEACRLGPLFDLVGGTPLIRLRRIECDCPGIELYGKAEFSNPGGSVKDRPARRMLLEGLASGALRPGKVILDATSGNTGIAYAMLGGAMRPTGPEIIRQTQGGVTHFVAGIGTSGTFVGVGRRLREHAPGVVLASMQPSGPLHGLEGLKHMDTAIVPGIYDRSIADVELTVDTEEAFAMTRRLAREEGLLVGISAGANVVAATRVAWAPAVVVTILCDGGERYLSERFWEAR